MLFVLKWWFQLDYDISDLIKLLIIKRKGFFQTLSLTAKAHCWEVPGNRHCVFLCFRQLFPVPVRSSTWVLSVKNTMLARGNLAKTTRAVLMQMKSKMGAISPVFAFPVRYILMVQLLGICLYSVHLFFFYLHSFFGEQVVLGYMSKFFLVICEVLVHSSTK